MIIRSMTWTCALLTATACGTQLTDGSFGGPTTAPAASNPNAVVATTSTGATTSATAGAQTLVCAVSGFGSSANGPLVSAHFTPNLIDLQQLLITADPNGGATTQNATTILKINAGDALYINNDPGAQQRFDGTLHASNSDLSTCSLCLQGIHANRVYSVVSGTLQLTTPGGDGSSMEAELHNLVLGHSNSDGSTDLWCVGDLYGGAKSEHWTCADLDLKNTPTCWNDAVGDQSLSLMCSPGVFQSGGTPALVDDCGRNDQSCTTLISSGQCSK